LAATREGGRLGSLGGSVWEGRRSFRFQATLSVAFNLVCREGDDSGASVGVVVIGLPVNFEADLFAIAIKAIEAIMH
tara:strand:+ start:9349 stop:9579 length:231 start_codon:yes stop_codon:yes gene_type:complete